MARKKKSGNTMLRMSPDVHARVDRAATALGMSMNALLNLMVRTSLPLYEMQADMLQDPKTMKILREWYCYNPTRGLAAFFADYLQLSADNVVPFEDGHLYALYGDELHQLPEIPAPQPLRKPDLPDAPGEASSEKTSNEAIDDIPF